MRVWKKPPELALPPARGGYEVALTCKFISPVFGGGVDPKRPDPVTPVRGAAIRGQLRFWWRATHADLTLDELRRREAALFGGVHGKEPIASAISLHVEKQPARPTPLNVFLQGSAFNLVDERLAALAYGAFPLRGVDKAKTHDPLFVYNDSFTIVLRARDVEELDARRELERALWAWLHFGGLGGRTRRGFGALALVEATGWTLPGIREGWPDGRRREVVQWPVLPAGADGVVTARTTATGCEAQEKLLNLLRQMRQGDLGRKPNKPRPGRSFWPEPDAIRKIYRITSGPHGQPIHTPRINKFPRAAFGTPIIFQFKREEGMIEPRNTTLVPAQREGDRLKPLGRLSSALILRPHAGDDRFEPMALRLAHPSPDDWLLLEDQREKGSVTIQLDDAEAQRISPLCVGGRSYRDPIAAYLARLATL